MPGAGRRPLANERAGLEHIPPQGPALLVARHYHHLFDGIALFAALPRSFHILVTLDWAQSSLVRNLMTSMTRLARWPVILRADALSQLQGRSVFSAADVVRYQRKGFRESVDLLVAGRILVIFPEGYPTIDPHYTPKTRDTELLPFKPGFVVNCGSGRKALRRKNSSDSGGIALHDGQKMDGPDQLRRRVSASNFTCREALVKQFERDVARLSGIGQTGCSATSRNQR